MKDLSKKKSTNPKIAALSLVSKIGKQAEENLLQKSTDNHKPEVDDSIVPSQEEKSQSLEKAKKTVVKKTVIQPYAEQKDNILVLDGNLKKDYKDFFEKNIGEMALTTINIDREKLSVLQFIAKTENNASVVKLVDNILVEWFINYKKDITNSYKKIKPPTFGE
jgi:hypothetical protein